MPNEIKLQFVNSHLSIKAFEEVTLPELSVICGPNGSGKTQLLQAIHAKSIKVTDTAGGELSTKIFQSTPKLVASHVTHAALQEIQNAALDTQGLISDLESCLSTGVNANVYDGVHWVRLDRDHLIPAIISLLSRGQGLQFTGGDKARLNKIIQHEHQGQTRNRWEGFKKFVPVKALTSLTSFDEASLKEAVYDFVQYQTFMEVDVSIVFYRYFEEAQNNAYRKASGGTFFTAEEFIDKFGNPPWDEVNALLKFYGFQHQVLPPSVDNDPRATNGYTARFINNNDEIINVDQLSSGEKVIIALLLSAYAARQKENNIFHVDAPEVILFDELDAHLHPSMTRMMFDVLQNSIVKTLSSRVIITTHSPSTVALAPEKSIYRLNPHPTHQLKQVSRAAASRDLSDGFIQLMDGSQVVIVEGKDDPLFYRAIERALRSNNCLPTTPTLHFVPASKTNDPSSGGGATAAEDWANKLNEAQLPNVHALLDNDGVRSSNGAIKVLQGRYAIENFILDPLSLAVALITDQRLAQVDADLGTKFPQVSSIASASQSDLQELVDKITAYIEANTPSLTAGNTVSVVYGLGKTINVPEWLGLTRGKDLVGHIREAFKQIDRSYIITRKDAGEYDLELGYLLKLWSQHPTLFPSDLATTLEALQP